MVQYQQRRSATSLSSSSTVALKVAVAGFALSGSTSSSTSRTSIFRLANAQDKTFVNTCGDVTEAGLQWFRLEIPTSQDQQETTQTIDVQLYCNADGDVLIQNFIGNEDADSSSSSSSSSLLLCPNGNQYAQVPSSVVSSSGSSDVDAALLLTPAGGCGYLSNALVRVLAETSFGIKLEDRSFGMSIESAHPEVLGALRNGTSWNAIDFNNKSIQVVHDDGRQEALQEFPPYWTAPQGFLPCFDRTNCSTTTDSGAVNFSNNNNSTTSSSTSTDGWPNMYESCQRPECIQWWSTNTSALNDNETTSVTTVIRSHSFGARRSDDTTAGGGFSQRPVGSRTWLSMRPPMYRPTAATIVPSFDPTGCRGFEVGLIEASGARFSPTGFISAVQTLLLDDDSDNNANNSGSSTTPTANETEGQEEEKRKEDLSLIFTAINREKLLDSGDNTLITVEFFFTYPSVGGGDAASAVLSAADADPTVTANGDGVTCEDTQDDVDNLEPYLDSTDAEKRDLYLKGFHLISQRARVGVHSTKIVHGPAIPNTVEPTSEPTPFTRDCRIVLDQGADARVVDGNEKETENDNNSTSGSSEQRRRQSLSEAIANNKNQRNQQSVTTATEIATQKKNSEFAPEAPEDRPSFDFVLSANSSFDVCAFETFFASFYAESTTPRIRVLSYITQPKAFDPLAVRNSGDGEQNSEARLSFFFGSASSQEEAEVASSTSASTTTATRSAASVRSAVADPNLLYTDQLVTTLKSPSQTETLKSATRASLGVEVYEAAVVPAPKKEEPSKTSFGHIAIIVAVSVAVLSLITTVVAYMAVHRGRRRRQRRGAQQDGQNGENGECCAADDGDCGGQRGASQDGDVESNDNDHFNNSDRRRLHHTRHHKNAGGTAYSDEDEDEENHRNFLGSGGTGGKKNNKKNKQVQPHPHLGGGGDDEDGVTLSLEPRHFHHHHGIMNSSSSGGGKSSQQQQYHLGGAAVVPPPTHHHHHHSMSGSSHQQHHFGFSEGTDEYISHDGGASSSNNKSPSAKKKQSNKKQQHMYVGDDDNNTNTATNSEFKGISSSLRPPVQMYSRSVVSVPMPADSSNAAAPSTTADSDSGAMMMTKQTIIKQKDWATITEEEETIAELIDVIRTHSRMRFPQHPKFVSKHIYKFLKSDDCPPPTGDGELVSYYDRFCELDDNAKKSIKAQLCEKLEEVELEEEEQVRGGDGGVSIMIPTIAPPLPTPLSVPPTANATATANARRASGRSTGSDGNSNASSGGTIPAHIAHQQQPPLAHSNKTNNDYLVLEDDSTALTAISGGTGTGTGTTQPFDDISNEKVKNILIGGDSRESSSSRISNGSSSGVSGRGTHYHWSDTNTNSTFGSKKHAAGMAAKQQQQHHQYQHMNLSHTTGPADGPVRDHSLSRSYDSNDPYGLIPTSN